jgi:hypothetical protein
MVVIIGVSMPETIIEHSATKAILIGDYYVHSLVT